MKNTTPPVAKLRARLTFSLGTLALAVLAPVAFPAQADLAAGLSARSPEDQVRDAGRKPTEVLNWLGIRPGMIVMDLVASGGWYTEVLSIAVGPEGVVYAQNPPMIYNFRDGFYDKTLSARLADGRLANVVRLDRDLGEVGLEPGSLDAAITALNFHDVVNNPNSAEAGAKFLAVVKGLLKPGGVLGLIDHVGDPDKDNAALHRLDVEAALPIIEVAGFEMASSDLLRNPDDDRTVMVFNPAIRGQTDRVLYKLTKPVED